MTSSPRRLPTVIGATVLVSVCVSLVLFFTAVNNRAYRTLFFPAVHKGTSEARGGLAGERRRVPAHSKLQANADQLVRELILGPSDPFLSPLLGPGTRLIGVVASGRDLYVNLTADLVLNPGILPPEEQIIAIASSLKYNFPRVRNTYVLIDGQAPDFSPMTGDPRYDFRRGVAPQPLVVE